MDDGHAHPNIVVIGSINMDLVARCRVLPTGGETLIADSFAEMPGGKGANQAVAASRAGGKVSMIGRIGDDGFAGRLTQSLLSSSVDCEFIQTTVGTPSGLAMISVADSGENQIVVVPGANGCLTANDIEQFAEAIHHCDTLLIQLEIPIESVLRAVEIANSAGTRVILDPAPAPASVPGGLLQVDLICPNETEAETLTGHSAASREGIEAAARNLHERGAGAVAITLGERGTVLYDGTSFSHIAPFSVNAIDSTAAGDAFAGAVAVRWAESNSLHEAIRWGNAAGAVAAARHGAQPSMGTRAEIDERAKR